MALPLSHGASLCCPRRAAQQPSAPLFKLPRRCPFFFPHGHKLSLLQLLDAPDPSPSRGSSRASFFPLALDPCRRAARPFFPAPTYSPCAAPPSSTSCRRPAAAINASITTPRLLSQPPHRVPLCNFHGVEENSSPALRSKKTAALRRAPSLAPSNVRRVLDEMCSSPDGSARCRLAVLLRSEQHAVDTRRLFAVFAQPRRRRRSPR
jgi:hypothetical protein